jgi:Coenzyme PQQ synthesis protein D (PqqD)
MSGGMEEATAFQVPEAVHTRRFGDELIILELSGGEYFSLDELGARIWEGLAAGRALGEVVEGIAPEYDVAPERFRTDAMSLAEELVRRRLLVARSSPPPA